MAPADSDEGMLRAQEEARGNSLMNRDFATFDALMSDDLVHVHSTGVKMNKRELCDYVRSKLAYLSIERPELRIVVKGDVGLMTGPMNNRLQPPGKEPLDTRSHVTQVWMRESGAWKLAAFHATRVAE